MRYGKFDALNKQVPRKTPGVLLKERTFFTLWKINLTWRTKGFYTEGIFNFRCVYDLSIVTILFAIVSRTHSKMKQGTWNI